MRSNHRSSGDLAAAQLRAAASRALARVEHWTADRWSRPAAPLPPSGQPPSRVNPTPPEGPSTHTTGEATRAELTRGEVMFALVQRLADLAAAAEGRSPRPVPRLDNDLALPDQLRVMVADLFLADAPVATLQAAAADIEATAALL